jgi:hypothetical protein
LTTAKVHPSNHINNKWRSRILSKIRKITKIHRKRRLKANLCDHHSSHLSTCHWNKLIRIKDYIFKGRLVGTLLWMWPVSTRTGRYKLICSTPLYNRNKFLSLARPHHWSVIDSHLLNPLTNKPIIKIIHLVVVLNQGRVVTT